MRFKDIYTERRQSLQEAQISPKNFEKTVEIFKRLLEKKIGSRLFRYGGPKGFVEIKRGIGILYIAQNKRAFRFNYVGTEITSITIWKDYKLGTSGDYTVDLDGIGLLQGAYKLIDMIGEKTLKQGRIRMFGMVDINESFLAEAKRIDVNNFAQEMMSSLPPGAQASRVSWNNIIDFAAMRDYQIPTAMKDKSLKTGKGKTATFDLTKVSLLGDKVTKSKDVVPDYYIKITAQDPNTKKFQSVKGDQRAAEILNQMKGAIENPNVEKQMKDPNTLFGIMKNLVQVVARGARNSLVVLGGAGIGKSFVVNQTLKEEGMSKGSDYVVIKGKITTTALYKTLYINRKGKLLVFDDADSMWNDQEASNILKAALDSYDEREISWFSNRTINTTLMNPEEREEYEESLDLKLKSDPEGNHKLPSQFLYHGRIIFISNLPMEKMDAAVLNRSAKIDMTLTDRQVFMRMESILENIGDSSVDINVKKEILQFLKDENMKGLLTAPSFRTYVAAEDLYKSGLPNWKELLQFV